MTSGTNLLRLFGAISIAIFLLSAAIIVAILSDPSVLTSTNRLGISAVTESVLGLHYKSDSAAGRFLAEQSYEILMECPTIKNIIVPNAANEWVAPYY